MPETKALFEPKLELNPFYTAAFGADFSQLTDEKSVKPLFSEKLNELVALIEDTLKPIKSITQVMEVFYYSVLSAVLLQNKAQLRQEDILLSAPPESSVTTMVLTQFEVMDESKSKKSREEENFDRYHQGKELAEVMSKQFAYSGSAMRALAMVTAMDVCSCRRNDMSNAYYILSEYRPTKILLDRFSKIFPVIGTLHRADRSQFAHTYSIPQHEMYRIETDTSNRFCSVFANKVAELLRQQDMDSLERARTEELRDFYLDTLCRFFFNIRIINFPRVLNLVSVVIENFDEGNRISEEMLNKVCPAECTALLGNEAILTKDSVDMNTTWYRVNGGISGFAALTNQFNLITGHKQNLLDEVVSKISSR